MIALHHIHKSYQTGDQQVPVLKDISLEIPIGSKTAIVGKSGSGKTTLLNLLTGIDTPDSGSIHMDTHDIHTFNEAQLADWRRSEVGIVFQFYHLFDTLSAVDNVRFPMELADRLQPREQKAKARDLLAKVGLGGMEHKFPHQLSGGEKQRVAIARALANDPAILAADEPTGNLDSKTTQQIKAIFDQLHQEGKTLLIVTHENINSEEYDQIIPLSDGKIAPSK